MFVKPSIIFLVIESVDGNGLIIQLIPNNTFQFSVVYKAGLEADELAATLCMFRERARERERQEMLVTM